MWKAKGESVAVYRAGRGVLGDFTDIRQAVGSMDYSVRPPRRLPKPEFWCVNYIVNDAAGVVHTEMITDRQLNNLEVKQVGPKLHYVMIPA